MRNPAGGFLFRLLMAVGLAILVLLLVQAGWLTFISYLLKQSQSNPLPISSTQVSGFSFPTAADPVGPGTEVVAGKLAITVTQVIRPANMWVGNSATYRSLHDGEQYLRVDVSVRCDAGGETCHVTEFDFGVSGNSNRDYVPEFSNSFSGLDGLFEGGDIPYGRSMSGALVFIIHSDDAGLVLVYPRMYSFGGAAKFRLDP